VQIAEGTSTYFALMVFGTIMLWVFSFNVIGGLDRVSGMLIFGQGGLGFVTPEVVKAMLGEAADSRLAVPDLTVTVYFVAQTIILIVCYLVALIRPKKALLDAPQDRYRLREMAIGAATLGFGSIVLLNLFGKYSAKSGGWATALLQLMAYVLPFAMALSIISEVKKTNGRRTINLLTISISTYLVYLGFVHSAKEALITPFAIYVVCCACMRVEFKPLKLLTLLSACLLVFFFFFPLVQSYHSTEQATKGLTFSDIADKLTNSAEYVREYNQKRDSELQEGKEGEYFGHEAGLFARYSLISLDAQLIESAKDGDYMGYQGIYEAVINWIPHFLLPNKPADFNSETYFHRLPQANQEDLTTGISFGVVGTSYVMGGWTALVILLPLVQGFFMLEMDVLLPSVSNTPWMVCLLADMLHSGPEANIDVMTTMAVQTPLRIAFVILIVRHGVRLFSSVFGGTQRTQQLEEFVATKAGTQNQLVTPAQ
jgi:hypothetical protein